MNNFYYNPKEMELNKWGYPIYKDSGKVLHWYIAEKYLLKRKLKEGEQIHHVDGDKLNFNPDNLIVMSKEDHKKIEYNIRHHKNLNLASDIIFNILLIMYGTYLSIRFDSQNIDYAQFIFLILMFIGVKLPKHPKLLRKFLFKAGILKNDRNRKYDIDYLWDKYVLRKTK